MSSDEVETESMRDLLRSLNIAPSDLAEPTPPAPTRPRAPRPPAPRRAPGAPHLPDEPAADAAARPAPPQVRNLAERPRRAPAAAPSLSPAAVGIDFGTSTTLVSVREDAAAPRVLPIGQGIGDNFVRSEVAFEQDGSILVGDAAAGASSTAIVARSVKRCLSCVPNRCQFSDTCWSGGKGFVEVAGQRYETHDVVQLIVAHAVEQAGLTTQLDTTPVALGCPVGYRREQREHLLKPAERALGRSDLDFPNIVPESGAAAVPLVRLDQARDGLTLIVDFGGGSLDLALVHVTRQDGLVENMAYSGDQLLGGDDVDAAIYSWILESIAQRDGVPLQAIREAFAADRVAQREVLQAARRAKEALARRAQAPIRVTAMPNGFPGASWSGTLSRDHLATLAKPVLQKMLNALTRLFRSVDLLPAGPRAREDHFDDQVRELVASGQRWIQHVLLVGGTCQLACVQELIVRIFGASKVLGDLPFAPTEAVALGLAYDHGRMLDALRPPFSFFLEEHTALHVETTALYQAYEPLYELHHTLVGGNIRYSRERPLRRGCTEAWLVVRDQQDEVVERVPIEHPFMATPVLLTIEQRYTLARVTRAGKTLFARYLTRYGQERHREEQQHKVAQLEVAKQGELERARQEERRYE